MILKRTNLTVGSQNGMDNSISIRGGKFKETLFKKSASVFFSDAAASAISQDMRGKMRELDQAVRYAQEGAAIAKAAQTGLEGIEEQLFRMKELVELAVEDISDEDRKEIQAEINRLNKEITNIAKETKYAGISLLSDDEIDNEGIGEEADSEIMKMIKSLIEKMGRNSFTAEALGVDKIDVSTAKSAREGLDIVNGAIKKVQEEIRKYKGYAEEFSASLADERPALKAVEPNQVLESVKEEIMDFDKLGKDFFQKANNRNRLVVLELLK